MNELSDLLELSKSVAVNAGSIVLENSKKNEKEFAFSDEHKKEVKAREDKILEQYIIEKLKPTGLSILSEESGYFTNDNKTKFQFIIDPLDGTFNFVKDLGPCAISIALWDDKKPLFGVVFDLQNQQLFWGGKKFGSYCNEKKIEVSQVNLIDEASVCTGFPVRFNLESISEMKNFIELVKPFAKVRMLGSAAMSLVNVSKGSCEIYSEKNIMIWDVAGGLAIIEGAGGKFQIEKASEKWSYNVLASNGHLNLE